MSEPKAGDPILIERDPEGDHLWDEIQVVIMKGKNNWLIYALYGRIMILHVEQQDVDGHPQWVRQDWNEPTRTKLLENP